MGHGSSVHGGMIQKSQVFSSACIAYFVLGVVSCMQTPTPSISLSGAGRGISVFGRCSCGGYFVVDVDVDVNRNFDRG